MIIKEGKVYCKECGDIVEFREGVPLDPMFIDEFDKENPRYCYCFKCRKKWVNESLKCKECGCKITMHQYLWHGGYCEEHEYIWEENYGFESKIKNLKDEDLPDEIWDYPEVELEYCNRGYSCVLDKKYNPIQDEEDNYLYRKIN